MVALLPDPSVSTLIPTTLKYGALMPTFAFVSPPAVLLED